MFNRRIVSDLATKYGGDMHNWNVLSVRESNVTENDRGETFELMNLRARDLIDLSSIKFSFLRIIQINATFHTSTACLMFPKSYDRILCIRPEKNFERSESALGQCTPLQFEEISRLYSRHSRPKVAASRR
jgi:hypothetical protein